MVKTELPWFYWREDSLFLHIYLQPRASKEEIVGLHQDAIKIRLKAAPIEGQANEALITFIAALFKVAQKNVIIKQGKESRKKWICIVKPTHLPASLVNSGLQSSTSG